MKIREQESHKSAQVSQPFVVALVSAYLFMVGLWLLITGCIRLPSLGRVVLSRMRPPYRGELQKANVRQDEGVAFVASVPANILSDKEAASALLVYEDDNLLGPPHSRHDDIRLLGRGRFSHWGSDIYFSASDNSDPRTNARKYIVIEAR